MPLSVTGNQLKSKFVKRYGSKKGLGYFYAKEKIDRKFARAVRGR